jgi:hypothetical protein
MALAPNADSVLIAENDTAIRSFAGLPLVSTSTIVILADSEKGREYSRQLAVSIQDLLTSVHSQVTVKASTCGHDGASAPACLYCGADDRQKLLVVVSDGKTGWNVVPNQQWWLSSESDRHILPLFQTGAHPEKQSMRFSRQRVLSGKSMDVPARIYGGGEYALFPSGNISISSEPGSNEYSRTVIFC